MLESLRPDLIFFQVLRNSSSHYLDSLRETPHTDDKLMFEIHMRRGMLMFWIMFRRHRRRGELQDQKFGFISPSSVPLVVERSGLYSHLPVPSPNAKS